MSRHARHVANPRVSVSKPAKVRTVPRSRREVASRVLRGVDSGWRQPFVPPEDWHEPTDKCSPDYRIIEQHPGPGMRHAVTPADIRERLDQLPEEMLWRLDVVQLSRLTRKKRLFPCYGMQWGTSLYLYPVPESLAEEYARAPLPRQQIEAAMYGGRWEETCIGTWRLVWTESALRDFYLNNILIHELGHLLDDRNRSHTDRERFAEWFAVEYGYKPSRRFASTARPILRRHHAK